MDQKEAVVQLWFSMWLQKTDLGIRDIFSEDAIYMESWGPEYRGTEKIKGWFEEWNTRAEVLKWDIGQYFHKQNQTVVEWYFKAALHNGQIQEFEGISLIKWTQNNQICFLKEFGCNIDRYDPYQYGKIPRFKNEKSAWF